MEIWKPVVGYEGLYEVSNIWNIRSVDRFIFWRKIKWMQRKVNIDTNWYNSIILAKNRIYSRIRFHRLVAKAFIPNPDNKSDINHIDWNKNNNKADNLEWNTKSENHIHRVHILWKFTKWKSVWQFSLDWILIKKFVSWKEAARSIKWSSGNISNCCRWIYKQAYWFIWKYL